MTDAEHVELLDTITNCAGAVYLSGYDNDLYNSKLSSWSKTSWSTKTVCAVSNGRAKASRREVLWWNR